MQKYRMNSVMNRQRSRRHLAALTFLSNISLDGTHRDTNLGRIYNMSNSLPIHSNNCCDKENHIEAVSTSESLKEKVNAYKNLKEFITKENLNNNEKDSSQSDMASQQFLPKEKSPLAEISEKQSGLKKRTSHHISLTEKGHCFSSCESLGTNMSGIIVRSRKTSGSCSETSITTTKEVKYLKSNLMCKVKDERLVFVSRNKIPCHIFSCIPFNRYNRVECVTKDPHRKRHTSGTRPLSTISDSTDPAHIVGLTCVEDPSEISFSDLLVPSKHFHRPKKSATEAMELLEHQERVLHHPGIARCYSYEPATHKATAHYVPHGSRSESFSGSLAMSKGRELIKALEIKEHLYRKNSSIRLAALANHADQPGFSQRSSTPCQSQPEKDDRSPPLGLDPHNYVANLLDDPELRAGKHRKLLRFPSYLTSIMDYTKPLELKKELNDKFRDKFPHIQLTLSKLRSLKREMLKIAKQECDIDLLTVAQAYVYFEKMILRLLLNKQNRKLIAGACLILSAKMNDVKGEALTNLIEKTETIFRLNRKDLIAWEFATMVALEFGLHVPIWQVNPHYQRILSES